MKCSRLQVWLTVAALAAGTLPAADIPGRSPANQVFQYMTTQSFTPPGHKTTTANAYLWIPPACPRVRGVLVLGQNVPEQWLVGHPAIREVCAEESLAILFTCRSFRLADVCADQNYPDKGKDHGTFLQQILDALAAESGYAELGTVPWLPMGESMSLYIPNLLTSAFPERCIAGIQIKDGQWDRLQSPGVPILVAAGTGAEWSQQTFDISTRWREMAVDDLRQHRTKRTAVTAWPGSLLVEGGSAHFACTEPMGLLIAQYIRAATRARLAPEGGPVLRPVDLDTGFVAGLPVPGAAPVPSKRYPDCTPEERTLPWYFDRESAQAAYDLASINWNAQPQLPVFSDREGQPLPFDRSGIIRPVPSATGDDGITFTLHATFLRQVPDHFVKGGTPLGHAPGAPVIEWLCGPFVPLGGNRFQIALDRSWGTTNIFARVWHPGDDRYRLATNPGGLELIPNQAGQAQTITFEAIPDQRSGVKEISLRASSDSGMPVRFFVKAGPAEIHGARLVFTPVPLRSKLPLAVTVVAWQWGRGVEPAVQTAPLVERSFRILAPR